MFLLTSHPSIFSPIECLSSRPPTWTAVSTGDMYPGWIHLQYGYLVCPVYLNNLWTNTIKQASCKVGFRCEVTSPAPSVLSPPVIQGAAATVNQNTFWSRFVVYRYHRLDSSKPHLKKTKFIAGGPCIHKLALTRWNSSTHTQSTSKPTLWLCWFIAVCHCATQTSSWVSLLWFLHLCLRPVEYTGLSELSAMCITRPRRGRCVKMHSVLVCICLPADVRLALQDSLYRKIKIKSHIPNNLLSSIFIEAQ